MCMCGGGGEGGGAEGGGGGHGRGGVVCDGLCVEMGEDTAYFALLDLMLTLWPLLHCTPPWPHYTAPYRTHPTPPRPAPPHPTPPHPTTSHPTTFHLTTLCTRRDSKPHTSTPPRCQRPRVHLQAHMRHMQRMLEAMRGTDPTRQQQQQQQQAGGDIALGEGGGAGSLGRAAVAATAWCGQHDWGLGGQRASSALHPGVPHPSQASGGVPPSTPTPDPDPAPGLLLYPPAPPALEGLLRQLWQLDQRSTTGPPQGLLRQLDQRSTTGSSERAGGGGVGGGGGIPLTHARLIQQALVGPGSGPVRAGQGHHRGRSTYLGLSLYHGQGLGSTWGYHRGRAGV